MNMKMLTTLLTGAALVALPVERAQADAGDFIAGAIIGGIVGAHANKKKRTRAYRPAKKKARRSRLPSTNEGRQIQSALNYFGFNAGSVDGQLGRKSRNAISTYQAHMGYPVTGHLTDFEQNFLINSHVRAQAGGAATMQQIAANPMGSRGLLLTYRDALSGATTTVTTAPLQVAPTQPLAVAPVAVAVAPTALAPQAVAPATEPAPALPSLAVEAAAPSEPALPNFLGGSSPVSLASHCNGISLLTNSNGGFTTVSSMMDTNFALNEQFCLARTYAIKQGEDMAAKLPGVTPQQISQQCEAFGSAMKDQIAAVSLKQQADVVRDTSSFILSTGMSPADLSGTAKICLSSGYRTDDMDVAIGSSLLLVALGEAVYGEMLGHHLSQGFGVSKRPDLAMNWYQSATTALESGATAVFAPGQPERVELLKAAATGMTGVPAQPDVQSVSTLPSFGAVDN